MRKRRREGRLPPGSSLSPNQSVFKRPRSYYDLDQRRGAGYFARHLREDRWTKEKNGC